MHHPTPLPSRSTGTWVQTDRAAHELWAHFLSLKGAATASRVLHILIARMGDKNACVISQSHLADELEVDPRTIRRAIAMLRDHRWIQTVNIGGAKSGVQGYVVNSRVAWQGPRDGIRWSAFDAKVYAREQEQEDSVDDQLPLRRIPSIFVSDTPSEENEG